MARNVYRDASSDDGTICVVLSLIVLLLYFVGKAIFYA
jgi:hypothetical protein